MWDRYKDQGSCSINQTGVLLYPSDCHFIFYFYRECNNHPNKPNIMCIRKKNLVRSHFTWLDQLNQCTFECKIESQYFSDEKYSVDTIVRAEKPYPIPIHNWIWCFPFRLSQQKESRIEWDVAIVAAQWYPDVKLTFRHSLANGSKAKEMLSLLLD